MSGRPAASTAKRGGISVASGGSLIHAGTVQVHAGSSPARALPARSVIVVATVAAKSAGSVTALGSVIVTANDFASDASATVLGTAVAPAVRGTDASFTVDARTGSENVTLIGAARSPDALPRAGVTSVTCGGVWSTVTVTGSDVTCFPFTVALAVSM